MDHKDQKSLYEEPLIFENELSDISSVVFKTDHGEVTLANALQDVSTAKENLLEPL